MSEHFLGYTVSIKCRSDLGTFQGQICNVNPKDQTITLKKAFRNGIPYSAAEVVLRGGDILNLSIIDTADTQVTTCSASTVAVKKPVAKRAFRSVSETIAINKGNQVRDSPRKPTDDLGVRILPIRIWQAALTKAKVKNFTPANQMPADCNTPSTLVQPTTHPSQSQQTSPSLTSINDEANGTTSQLLLKPPQEYFDLAATSDDVCCSCRQNVWEDEEGAK